VSESPRPKIRQGQTAKAEPVPFSDKAEFLLVSASHGEAESVREALEMGADAHAAWPPFDMARARMHPQLSEGDTALHMAAKHGSAEMVKMLAPLSNLGAQTPSGETALMTAIESGCGHCARALLAAMSEEEVNLRENMGHTALTLACDTRSETIFAALMADGRSDLFAKNHAGQDALDCALNRSAWGCAKALLPNFDAPRRLEAWADRSISDDELKKGHPLPRSLAEGLEALHEWVPSSLARRALRALGPRDMPTLSAREAARAEAESLRDALSEASVAADRVGANNAASPDAEEAKAGARRI
jgi:hypothetical protein